MAIGDSSCKALWHTYADKGVYMHCVRTLKLFVVASKKLLYCQFRCILKLLYLWCSCCHGNDAVGTQPTPDFSNAVDLHMNGCVIDLQLNGSGV